MRLNFGFRSLIVVFGVACGVSQAQVSMASRQSTQEYHYLYGWSTDIHQDNVTASEGTLNSSDFMSTTYTGYTEGYYEPTDTSWTAGIDGRLDHNYSIGGPLNAAWNISASGRSEASTYATGSGYGENWTKAPGNELIFEFDVMDSVEYTLDATYGGDGNFRPTYLALQFFQGGFWNYIVSATNFFNPDLNGSLFDTGTLGAGHYRMVSSIGLDSRTLEGHVLSQYGDYNYTLSLGSQPVPEPSTIALLGLGIAALNRRVKKAKK